MKIGITQYEKLLHEEKLDLLLKGNSGFKGISIGYARVGSDVKSIKDNIKEGDILVVPSTKPPDVPYLIRCDGIITDGGGKTSHAAVFCKYHNIPCIIGTGNATKILENYNGKLLIYVDMNIGLVYKIKEV